MADTIPPAMPAINLVLGASLEGEGEGEGEGRGPLDHVKVKRLVLQGNSVVIFTQHCVGGKPQYSLSVVMTGAEVGRMFCE